MNDPLEAPGEVTALLQAHGDGDPQALNRLLPIIYNDLRSLAQKALRGRNPDQTLQPTALTHEVWIKLSGGLQDIAGRKHFFALAGRAMRQILTDFARAAGADKRGGGRQALTLSIDLGEYQERGIDLLELNETLERLAQLKPRHAQIVDLRFFSGLTIAETAEVLEVSTTTVESDWAMARAWLLDELRDE